jgi:hypothetical protein
MTTNGARPLATANRITQVLDAALGPDRFDEGPVDMAALAKEYSQKTCPDEPIALIDGGSLDGCAGTLFPSDGSPRRWAIIYDRSQSPGRRNFTIGHEFGHYMLHRHMLGPEGIRCDDNAVLYRDGEGIEKEADEFAATLLMPLNDFRRQIPETAHPDLDRLGEVAKRYGVSLTAATLRWLEYTKTKALFLVSNEGFAHWAKSSPPAYNAYRFIRTKNVVFELPSLATGASGEHSKERRLGIVQEPGVWFAEPVLEQCLRSERYDLDFTLLHLDPGALASRPATTGSTVAQSP